MWQFEHAIECPVRRAFAWQFWSDVSNWPVVDPGVEAVEIDGPFAAGATITTKPHGMPPVTGHLVEMEAEERACIEVPAPGAVARFLWLFADAGGGTRLTQQVSITGAQADHYAQTMGPGLASGIPAGMEKLAAAMSAAYADSP